MGRRIVKSSQARVVFHERGSARQGCKPEGQDSVGQVQGIEAMAKVDDGWIHRGYRLPG